LEAAHRQSQTNDSSQTTVQTNAVETTLATAKAEVASLEEAQTRSVTYALRERLSAEKHEQGRLAETIESNQQIVKKTTNHLARAKDLIRKASAHLNAARGAIDRDTATAHRLAGQIEADQVRLQHLLATLRSNQAGTTNSP